MSKVLPLHKLWHAWLLCSPLSPEVFSNSCSLNQWCSWTMSSLPSPSTFVFNFFSASEFFPNEPDFHLRCPKYWSFNFGISPSSECSGLISFRFDWFALPQSKELSRVFSRTIIWKHQFFGAQPSLWPNSHIHTWLLEKTQLWFYKHFSAK